MEVGNMAYDECDGCWMAKVKTWSKFYKKMCINLYRHSLWDLSSLSSSVDPASTPHRNHRNSHHWGTWIALREERKHVSHISTVWQEGLFRKEKNGSLINNERKTGKSWISYRKHSKLWRSMVKIREIEIENHLLCWTCWNYLSNSLYLRTR